MSLQADQIVDRRRLRRRLSFWRVIAFVALAAALIAGIGLFAGADGLTTLRGPHVARITIDGFISEDRDQMRMIDRLAKNPSVRAVIVSIDSTGGSSAGGEALYEALRRLAAEKPTVATMGTVAASAAYMAAIATDHIVARRSTITGSIGVIFQYPEVGELLDTLGVDVEEIKSGPLKAEPSPFRPASPEARQVIADLVDDTYDWFVDIVAERRGLDRAATATLADGRVFSGRQALQARLVDALGGEETARAWLAEEKDVPDTLPVRSWGGEDEASAFSFSRAALIWAAREIGVPDALLRTLGPGGLLPQRLELDGLLSVWQGPFDQNDGEGRAR